MYTTSDEMLGLNISLSAWNVVLSHISSPIISPSFLATGSYSSAFNVLPVGNITRSLGRYSVCFLVLCTAYAQFRAFRVLRTSAVPPGFILSRSRVIRSLEITFPARLKLPFSNPPTYPPTSFRLSCFDFA